MGHRDANDNSLKWDDPLPRELEEKFISWTNQLEKISCAEYPRYLFPEVNTIPDQDEIYLHIFCDAGDNCYGIAAYIRYENKITHKYYTKLIYACSRTAPSKSKYLYQRKNCAPYY